MKQAICDRCGAVISSLQEDVGQLALVEMTEDWEPTPTSEPLGDLCTYCVRHLRAWLKTGGKKPRPGQG